MNKSFKRLFVMFVAVVLVFSLVPAIGFATTVTSTDKTDSGSGVEITSKSKTVSYKITYNANGGKIGTKKTVTKTVKKGSKLNKLAATPKRSGYTFKGWYTKKTGGTKITKNTKPKNSVTYYARWSKTTSSSKLIGKWAAITSMSGFLGRYTLYFYQNGSFSYIGFDKGWEAINVDGKYSISNGKVYFKEMKVYDITNIKNPKKFKCTITAEYKLGKYELSSDPYLGIYKYLFSYDDKNAYYSLEDYSHFDKQS